MSFSVFICIRSSRLCYSICNEVGTDIQAIGQNTTTEGNELGMDIQTLGQNTTTEDPALLPLLMAIDWVCYYGLLFPLAFGIPGNIFSFFIAMKKDNRRLSMCWYIAGTAVADSLAIFQANLFIAMERYKWGVHLLPRIFLFK